MIYILMAIKILGFTISKDKGQGTAGVKKNIFTDPSFSDITRTKGAYTSQKEQLSAYGSVGWVAIAVDCIASDVGSRDYYFVDRKTQEYIEPDQVDKRITAPFDAGFGNLTFQQMHAIITAHTQLTGNGLLLKLKTSAFGIYKDTTENFAFIPPSNFAVVTKPNGLQLVGYEIRLADNSYIFATPDQVIHLSQNNVFSAFVGMGNIEKIRTTIEGEVYSDDFNNEFMARKASPSLAIVDKGSVTDPDFERTKDILRREYEGRQNSGKILYLAGADVSINELGMSQKDIQYIEKKQWDRQTILSAFGVSPERAGLTQNSNRSTVDQMLSQYYKNVNNVLIRNANMINKQFVWTIDPTVELKFEQYSTGETDMVVKQLQAGIISPNMASDMLGVETDYNDDVLNQRFMLSGYIPITGIVAPEVTPPTDDNNADDTAKCDHQHPKKKDKSISDPTKVDEIVDMFYGENGIKKSRPHQAQFLRTALNTRNEITNKYTGNFMAFFDAQKERVLKSFNDHFKSDAGVSTKAIDNDSYKLIFDLDAENSELLSEAKRIHTSGVQRSIMDTNNIMGGSVEFSLSNPFVKNTIAKIGKHLVYDLAPNGYTQDQLKKLMAQGVANSWNINEYQKAIEAEFEMFKGYRARMIARTESRSAYDAGNQIAFKDLGVETIDVVGCTQFEPDSDCGATDVPIADVGNLVFHPNHIGTIAPSAVA